MNLLYISMFLFYKEGNITYALPSCSDSFFQKYLDVFDSIKVLGAPMESYLDKSALVQMRDKRISVDVVASNTRPKDFLNDKVVLRILEQEIKKAEAILIKPASRRGMFAIKIAEKLNKPYMIEMTGDIHDSLKKSASLLKRLYAPIIYRQITKSIKDCKFGIYVSQKYLQEQYPIAGEMCGCSDVVLEKSDESVLQQRLAKIEQLDKQEIINISLIGFYQGKMKGVDTAIRALSHLPAKFHLSILGNGTQSNRDKWYKYAEEHGVGVDRIHFPKPLPSSAHVLLWLDSMDIFVLPTHSEGLPRCVVEAMSRACPCFATNICTLPELLSEDCLFELDDDEKLADMLLYYSSNLQEMKKLARMNFEKSKEYDFDVLKRRRNQFLDEFRLYAESMLGYFLNYT